jgi:Mrp family chromosome partitioning ATPase
MQKVLNLSSRWIIQDRATASGLNAETQEPLEHQRGSHADTGTPPRRSTTSKVQPGALQAGKLSAYEAQRLDPRSLLVQRQCLKLGLSIFSRPHKPARSLGFTSAIAGEGKSFLASALAVALAKHARRSITLVDCNWEHPAMYALFDLPESPGLAEWARGECSLTEIRHEVAPHLTVIPAGMALGGAIEVTRKLAAGGMHQLLADADEVLIADMASVLTTVYSAPLAQLLDAVALVVRAGVTWDTYIAEARHELEDATVEGLILNATMSRIPRWLQRIL